jgi:putative nucleotidyltransferase with HDIG domain
MNIKTQNINEDLVLNKDVILPNGILLIPEGEKITESIKKRLLEFGVYQVDAKDKCAKDKSFIDFEMTYNEALAKIKDSFKDIRYKKNIEITKFEKIAEDLIKGVNTGQNLLPYMKLIETKDEYTLRHSINVSIAATLMGKWVKYSESEIKILAVSALLHDIGKIMIPDYILNKPGKLSQYEFKFMKNHPKLGFELLLNSGIVDDTIRKAVLTHHERIDGKGYPFGIAGKNIGEVSRIISICDVYDAVTSKRVYKEKENPLKGLKIVFDDSYNGLDPYLCKVFLNNLIDSYLGSKVLLSNGKIGKIIRIMSENPDKPWVAINDDLYDLNSHINIEIVDML